MHNSKLSIFLFSALLCFIISCKNREDTISPQNNINLKLAFSKSSTGSTLTNVQVGDTLTFNYEINAQQTNGKFALIPQVQSPIKHQIINTDYELFLKDKKITDTLFVSSLKGSFKVYIKKPGNFQLGYQAVNINGKNTFTSASQELLFNPVKIIAYSYNWMYRSPGTFHHSQWRYFHKLYIDTGDQANDQYLTELPYEVSFLSYRNTFSSLRPRANIDFYDVQDYTGDSNASVQASSVNKLIFKKYINGVATTIEYNNIPVRWMGRHDDWEYNGSSNW